MSLEARSTPREALRVGASTPRTTPHTLGRVLGQQGAIELAVIVAEEGLGAAITALGEVVRNSGKDSSGKTGHLQSVSSKPCECSKVHPP